MALFLVWEVRAGLEAMERFLKASTDDDDDDEGDDDDKDDEKGSCIGLEGTEDMDVIEELEENEVEAEDDSNGCCRVTWPLSRGIGICIRRALESCSCSW